MKTLKAKSVIRINDTVRDFGTLRFGYLIHCDRGRGKRFLHPVRATSGSMEDCLVVTGSRTMTGKRSSAANCHPMDHKPNLHCQEFTSKRRDIKKCNAKMIWTKIVRACELYPRRYPHHSNWILVMVIGRHPKGCQALTAEKQEDSVKKGLLSPGIEAQLFVSALFRPQYQYMQSHRLRMHFDMHVDATLNQSVLE